MTDARFVATLKEGGTPSVAPGIGQVEPPNIRAKLMLETLSHMVAEPDWPYRHVSLDVKSQGDELGAFRLLGANEPESIRAVFERRIDLAILNPAAILTMAHRGVGLFSQPMEVALIAVMPHYDQLGFAVTRSSGLSSLDDIREKRFPLRVSVRGSMDACTHQLVNSVLRAHGFSYDDIIAWGGSVSYDQLMPGQPAPQHPSRIERVVAGTLDAIFEEGVAVWANRAEEVGMRFLDIDNEHLALLQRQGFRRASIEKARFARLPADVATVDFSGWPIYCRKDTPGLLVRKFCEALEARKDAIPWTWGPIKQKPMPLERMVIEAPDTPIDVPFHPVAREFWMEKGYIQS